MAIIYPIECPMRIFRGLCIGCKVLTMRKQEMRGSATKSVKEHSQPIDRSPFLPAPAAREDALVLSAAEHPEPPRDEPAVGDLRANDILAARPSQRIVGFASTAVRRVDTSEPTVRRRALVDAGNTDSSTAARGNESGGAFLISATSCYKSIAADAGSAPTPPWYPIGTHKRKEIRRNPPSNLSVRQRWRVKQIGQRPRQRHDQGRGQ